MNVNEGYYKAKVNKQDFYLRLRHIARLSRVPDNRDKIYFDNVQLEYLIMFARWEELNEAMVNAETNLMDPMRAQDITKMFLVF